MTARIAVFGSASMDLVVRVARAPRLGETVAGSRFLTVPGGKGANQAIAAARAGAEVRMLGAVGQDGYGDEAVRTLAASGVDTARVRRVPGPTGTAHITVTDEGANAIVVVAGANAALTGLEDADHTALTGSDLLLLQLEVPVPGVMAAARAAHRSGARVVLTPAPVVDLGDGLLDSVDLLVPNEHEAAELTGASDPEVALAALLERVPEVVVTLGEHGCLYGAWDGTRIRVPGVPAEVVDTTAAGDTFVGALAVALAEGQPIETALGWANAAAALSVGRLGASTSMPQRAEIEAAVGTDR